MSPFQTLNLSLRSLFQHWWHVWTDRDRMECLKQIHWYTSEPAMMCGECSQQHSDGSAVSSASLMAVFITVGLDQRGWFTREQLKTACRGDRLWSRVWSQSVKGAVEAVVDQTDIWKDLKTQTMTCVIWKILSENFILDFWLKSFFLAKSFCLKWRVHIYCKTKYINVKVLWNLHFKLTPKF